MSQHQKPNFPVTEIKDPNLPVVETKFGPEQSSDFRPKERTDFQQSFESTPSIHDSTPDQLSQILQSEKDADVLEALEIKRPKPDEDLLVLEVQELRKDYGSRPVLKGLSFKVYAGEIIGILGMNAAGKTTLFKSLLGVTPFEGMVKIDGIKNNVAATSVLWVPNGMEDDMTVRQNIRYYYALFGRRWDQYEARNLLVQFGIDATWHLTYKFLSTGQRRKLAIMRSFIKENVSVYLMDEPTGGLDILSQNRFVQIVRKRMKRERSCTLMITHNAQDLQRRVDRILVLNEGRILDFGTLPELTERHMKGYLVKAAYSPDDDVTSVLRAIFKQFGLFYSLEQGFQMNSLFLKVPDLRGFESTYRQISKYFTFVSLQKQNLTTFIELTLSGRKFQLA